MAQLFAVAFGIAGKRRHPSTAVAPLICLPIVPHGLLLQSGTGSGFPFVQGHVISRGNGSGRGGATPALA